MRRGSVTVGLAFLAMFVAVGTGFSYGSLVVPLARELAISQGSASGVFAVTVMVFFLVGAPMGFLADRVGARLVLAAGALAMGGGLTLTATARDAPQLYLGSGLLVGVGMASTFVPLVALVGASFERRRSAAVGVAVSGIGMGTLVIAPFTGWLIAELGWRSAYLRLAAISGIVMVLCAVLVPSGPQRSPDPPKLAEAFRTRRYQQLYLAQMLLAVAVFMPFAHLPAYAQDSGVDPVGAAGLVGIIGGASVAGRLALGAVADRLGLLPVYIVCYLAVAGSFALWFWPGAPFPALVVHAVIFGVGYGGFVALQPGVVAERFGVERLGALLGVLYTSHVVGAGAGPLVAGLLIPRHGYLPAAVAAMVCGLLGAAVLSLLRATERRETMDAGDPGAKAAIGTHGTRGRPQA